MCAGARMYLVSSVVALHVFLQDCIMHTLHCPYAPFSHTSNISLLVLTRPRVLYDELHLDRQLPKAVQTPKGQKSVASAVLSKIAANTTCGLPRLILEHRRVKKIVSTFCEGILDHVKVCAFNMSQVTRVALFRLTCLLSSESASRP